MFCDEDVIFDDPIVYICWIGNDTYHAFNVGNDLHIYSVTHVFIYNHVVHEFEKVFLKLTSSQGTESSNKINVHFSSSRF